MVRREKSNHKKCPWLQIQEYLVEDMLKKNGGVYSKIEDWSPYAIVDGRSITGQNPASSEKVAEELLKLI